MAETGAWMPIYWADYLADTMHLNAEQHGAYLLLLAAYWRRGAPLSDDDKYLSAVARLSLKKWKMVRPIVAAFFSQKDGVWTHKRVNLEILRSSDRLKFARAAGQAGGLAKSKLVTVTETQDSAPNGAGAAAPPTDRDWLWKDGLDRLAKHSGKPGASLRSVLGRWLKITGDDAAQVRAEIEAATGPPNPVADPVAWIEARLKPKAPHGQSEQLRRRTAQFAGLAAAAESLAAGQDAGSGLAALPKPGVTARGVEIAESGLSESLGGLPLAGG